MEGFNRIELQEIDGIGKIKIDETELKGVSEYNIKRDTDIVTLTVSISVPSKSFMTSLNQ